VLPRDNTALLRDNTALLRDNTALLRVNMVLLKAKLPCSTNRLLPRMPSAVAVVIKAA
jgi:hypothetical protein